MTRVLLRASAAVLLLLASALIGWRVLGPAERLDTSSAPYPPLVVSAPGVQGRIGVAPLIFNDRLRIYAAKHQLRADEPVYGRAVYTSRWSLRRWPQQLSGVVTSGTTVVSRWSDGLLVGQDGRTGKILWRTSGPDAPDYAGHRTGAAAVWSPPGLRIAAGSVVVTQGQDLFGYDVSTGAERWRATPPAGCVDGFTTAGGVYVCATGAYDATSGRPMANWPAGPFTALGCLVAGSNCAGFRDAAGHGWLAAAATPRRAAALDSPDATVAAGVVVSVVNGVVTGHDPDGAVRWTWPGEARVLGGSSSLVLLVRPDHHLITLEAATGRQTADVRLAFGKEDDLWKFGGYQIAEHYLAIERRRLDGPDDPESPIYYYTTDTVLLAGF
ncbi:serine/threonine protein kinase [Actinoplanes oblitus]|uniref:Serine/threonine protein kinase n=1 Tax=Actinoplanes oblitus TaxID=3040509 RepID=A0ABY8WH73_9ACTN|nr:serine/threonine protein kinase [Actinoplanes oblitus]WIM96200.1 serine/threonine protein kinase [Actinoplanes oblitus]